MKFPKIGFLNRKSPAKQPVRLPLGQRALACKPLIVRLSLVLPFVAWPHLSGGVWVQSDTIPPPLTNYNGREIAQTMHYLGAPWLTRESRDREDFMKTTGYTAPLVRTRDFFLRRFREAREHR